MTERVVCAPPPIFYDFHYSTLTKGSLAERLASITMDVKAIVFHPSGDYLALGGEDGSVLVYEWPSMKNKLDLRQVLLLLLLLWQQCLLPASTGGAESGRHI